jgi:hypothetical protein
MTCTPIQLINGNAKIGCATKSWIIPGQSDVVLAPLLYAGDFIYTGSSTTFYSFAVNGSSLNLAWNIPIPGLLATETIGDILIDTMSGTIVIGMAPTMRLFAINVVDGSIKWSNPQITPHSQYAELSLSYVNSQSFIFENMAMYDGWNTTNLFSLLSMNTGRTLWTINMNGFSAIRPTVINSTLLLMTTIVNWIAVPALLNMSTLNYVWVSDVRLGDSIAAVANSVLVVSAYTTYGPNIVGVSMLNGSALWRIPQSPKSFATTNPISNVVYATDALILVMYIIDTLTGTVTTTLTNFNISVIYGVDTEGSIYGVYSVNDIYKYTYSLIFS